MGSRPITDFLPIEQKEFNHWIEALGPWGLHSSQQAPVGVAVSGGADSLCLALLASRWCHNIIAFIVDHGLRPDSAEEAVTTERQLSKLSIPSKILTLTDLSSGTAIEERARIARYKVILSACRKIGCIDLLLGHHAGDQAETVLMRIRAGSGHDGLSAMAQIMELSEVRLVRPLLTVPPQRLKATLRREGIEWIEDPSNSDLRIQRNRLRQELSSGWENTGSVSILLQRAKEEGQKRMERDQREAKILAHKVQLYPEGFALLPEKGVEARALGALIRTISGSIYTPFFRSLESLARNMRSVTLGGVHIIPAGRMGAGWLMIREETAIEEAVPVQDGLIWDRRFKLYIPEMNNIKDMEVGSLGVDYRQFSSRQSFPVSILKTLPVIRHKGNLVAVPHLGIALEPWMLAWRIVFQPRQPVAQSFLFSIEGNNTEKECVNN